MWNLVNKYNEPNWARKEREKVTAYGFAAWLVTCHEVVCGESYQPVLFGVDTLFEFWHTPKTSIFIDGEKMTVQEAFESLWMSLDQFDRDMWERVRTVRCSHDTAWFVKKVVENEGYSYKEHLEKTVLELCQMLSEDGCTAASNLMYYLQFTINCFACEHPELSAWVDVLPPFNHGWPAVWKTARKVTTEAECLLLARQTIQTYAGFQQGELDDMSWDDMLDFTEQEIREVYPFMLYLDKKRTDLVWQPDPYFEGLDK